MSVSKLRQLGRAYGVQSAYQDVDKRQQVVPPEALVGVLKAMGAPVDRIEDAPDALRERTRNQREQTLEPVVVCRAGLTVQVHVPAAKSGKRFRAELKLETGELRQIEGLVEDLPTVSSARVEGTDWLTKALAMPGECPWGYHQLTLELAGESFRSLVISAPDKVFNLWTGDRRRSWGLFLPLYALHSDRSWGCGDLTDLEKLADWTASEGGLVTATLPLLASFWEQTEDYSPYSPASRLFWNEFYLDVTRLAGFDTCRGAKALCESDETRRTLDEMKSERFVDYEKLVALKGRLLRLLSAHFFEQTTDQRAAFDRFVESRPEARSYAGFRAACARHGIGWDDWPEPLRSGRIEESDIDPVVYRHHLYVQWQMDEQLGHVSRQAGEQGSIWYLDLPLGVSRAGYDTWLERDTFALGANGGAPPDAFFSKGQNWFFPPIHPEGSRRTGYRYLISVLRQHLRYAKLLRIDHAACLHRLFWIPENMDATHGAYVRYPADELYAILALESHRAGAGIVGEDLGTVPRYITRSLRRHGISSMYILPFEIDPERKPAVQTPGTLTLAGLNTHDMPPFASFWKGTDIDQRVDLDLIDASSRESAQKDRDALRMAVLERLRQANLLAPEESDLQRILEACLGFLGRSSSELVLVNLEDLWLETQAQNMPGTFKEHPNWCSKAALTFAEIRADPQICKLLDRMRQNRQ